MRRLIEILIIGTVALVIGGMLYYRATNQTLEHDADFVAGEVRRFELEIKVRAATTSAELTERAWPMTIDPAWFESPPQNTLVSRDRPWVEVAPPEHAELFDPVYRIALDPTLASFWYNPYQGVIRARVPIAINDEQALRLYNRINGTRLTELYATPPLAPEKDPDAEKNSAEQTDDPDSIFFRTHTENERGKPGSRVSGAGGG